MTKQIKKLELQGKKKEELVKMLHDAKEALFSMRMDFMQQKLKDSRSLFHKRKEIARILTIIKESEVIQ